MSLALSLRFLDFGRRQGGVVTAEEIGAKSDSELLEIWKHQVDYREEVVAWVGDEIARRGLRTDEVVVVTEDHQAAREEEYYASKFRMFRLLRVSFFGGIAALFGLGALVEGIRDPRDRPYLLILAVGLLGLAAVLIWLARRGWKKMKL